ncbi:hypothetical protein [Paenibacillus sp. YYML68]|uniref:hypothetical protein n=1 Tax=Paenibacillus sp. YYML68 TaxID=2909250 RepID=UPI00249295F1|nr:hypothetical protein [Paenibacillus sp. YYML68]
MRTGKLLIAVMLLVLLAACGGGQQAEVPIFMMTKSGTASETVKKLETALVEKLGESPTVSLGSTPVFSLEKLMVEVAAGGNGILIVPGEQFHSFAKQGGFVSLDDIANPEDFPDGYIEQPVDGQPGKMEKHLYGIHLEKTKWFLDLGYNGKDLYAFIPQNSNDIEKAKQVMKVIAQK